MPSASSPKNGSVPDHAPLPHESSRVVVPLPGVEVPDTTIGRLQNGLNIIYSQSVVSWNVQPLYGFTGVELGDNGLDWADKEMLSAYNKEMNSVIKAFKDWKKDADKDAYYLFVVPKFSESKVEGFMPLGYSYGFVTKEQLDAHTVAHELGHGAFALRHTFSEKNAVSLPQGKTDNLMDYAKGNGLFKYQWDLIHDPQRPLFAWTEDMEEGASVLSGQFTIIDEKHTLLLNHIYDNNNKDNLKYLEKIEKSRQATPTEKSLDLDYTGTAEKEWISSWKLRTATSDEIIAKIVKKIQDAEKGKKIASMSLHEKGIYIGKYKLDEVEYPIAIYSEKATIDKITKVQVSEIGDLDKDENKRYIKSEETFIKYLVIAFYEEGNSEPVLIMQIEKFDISQMQNTKEKWLEYLEILLSSVNVNYEMKLFNGKDEINENKIFLISSTPEMPDIRASVTCQNEDLKLRLKIIYDAYKNGIHVRYDSTWYPESSWKEVNSGEIWDIDFGTTFRGGTGYLFFKQGQNIVDTIIFHIRGINPTEQEVHTYVNTLSDANGWYVPKMIRQESSFRQFNNGTPSATNNTAGMPNWGPPYGWGMMQLDNLEANFGYKTVIDGVVVRQGGASPDELWNWKFNVRKGIEFFNRAKIPTANSRWNNALNSLVIWESQNPQLTQVSYTIIIIDSPDESEENTTVTEIVAGNETNTETFTANSNPANGQRTLRDAFALKFYNGGADYFTLVIPASTSNTGEDPPALPHWNIDKAQRISSGNGGYVEVDYVDEISGRYGW